MTDEEFMDEAVRIAVRNVSEGGGPFGAVIVKDGKIVARGVNRVTASLDPTAHAEVQAIRAACRALGSFSLEGCVLYTSCEPCPMCLSAVYWARIDRIFYACTRDDAERAGFSDRLIYDELRKDISERSVREIRIENDRFLDPFREWDSKADRTDY